MLNFIVNITAIMKHHLSHVVILLISFGLLGFYSCKKDNGPSPGATDTSGYSISYTGNPYVGDTLHFQAIGNANATFLWKFGDSTTATLMSPNHIYTAIPYRLTSGYYQYSPDTVTLIVNNDTLHPITKIVQIYPGVQRMGGMKIWHRTQYAGPNNNVSSYALPDTTFPVNIIDDTTISILGISLKLDPNYAIGVSNNPNLYAFTGPYYFDIFSYYPESGLIGFYQDLSNGALGGKDYILYSVSP